MCNHRFYLFIFIWFLIHLLLITPKQCRRHRRGLDHHYLHHETRPIPYNCLSEKLPFQNKKSRCFKLKEDNLPKSKINSISPISKVKLTSSFMNDSNNSVISPMIRNWPQYLDNSSNENESTISKNGEEKLKTPTKRTEFFSNSLQSENENVKKLAINRSSSQGEESSTSVKTDTTFKEFDENSKILTRVKRYANNNLTISKKSGEKTLLNLDGSKILEDLESSQDQDSSVHIRVKRDNPNKNNVVSSFKSNYLEDLAASFPKSEHELEEKRLASNKVEDEGLFKRSSDYEKENFKTKRFASSNGNSPIFKDEENLGYQQENLDLGVEEPTLEHRKKRNNYAKVHPEFFSMKDEGARSDGPIANDYQKKNLRKDASNEYANDNQDDIQILYRKDKLSDSMLQKMDDVVENKNYLGKMDQQKDQNYASKNRNDLDSYKLYSSEVLQKEQPNDANLNSNKKVAKGKKLLLSSEPRDKRRMAPSKKHHKRKIRKNKLKKKPKKKKLRKRSKLSKIQESLNQLDKTRVSAYLNKSELIDVDRSKRDIHKKSSALAKDVNNSLSKIQKSVDSNKRFRRSKREDKQCIRAVNDDNQEVKYYEKMHEPEKLNRNDISKSKVDRERTALTEVAMKSIEEIKTLVDKLVAKVSDLENIVGMNVHKSGEKDTDIKENSNLKQSLKNSKRCMVLEKHGSATSRVITECNLNTEKAQLLQENRDEKQKKFLKIEKKADSNHLVQLRPHKIPRKIRERNTGRRKRKSRRKWDRWTDWSGCSVTCGKGRQIRWRHCIRDCRVAETELEEKTCQLPACPPGKFLGIF